MTLGVVAAILCLMLVLAGASMGLTGSLAFSQPSPSGSASEPGGESGSIFLLNPNPGYDPGADTQEPPSPNPDPDQPTVDYPKLSDKFDGQDTAYHIVAAVKDPPSTALVEAYWQSGTANEVTIGELTPVPGDPETYELFWDIPSSISSGSLGNLIVRLYEETPQGFEQLSEDSVQARTAHAPVIFAAGGPVSAAETVEFTWPSQNGPLGFFKGAASGAVWTTVVNGTASPPKDPEADPVGGQVDPDQSSGARQIVLFYTKTKPGKAPEFVRCGSGNTGGGGPDGSMTFNLTCDLQGTDRPTQVTALAAVALEDQSDGEDQFFSQESADVHTVQPYLQRVEDMTLELDTSTASDSDRRRHTVIGASNAVCMAYRLTVKDALDRPVQGANVDIHVRGPGDTIQFGDEAGTGQQSSTYGKPQKDHSAETGRDCDANANFADIQQGDHNVPGADDTKHLESGPGGTGKSGGGGTSRGQWQFHLWSPSVGDTSITAWLDEESVLTDQEKRAADDDLLEDVEASDTNFVQWLPAQPAVTIDPTGATAAAGECQRFIVRVRGGARAVRGANVDVHATGPSNDLDFCDPGDGSVLNAPTEGTGHNAEDEREVTHAGQPPVAQHTEGQTNDAGNLIIGITSPVAGDTTLTAWYDSGEAPFDNDVQDTGEASGSATTNWIVSSGDAAISWVNPSPYGSAGTNVANTRDVDDAYHLVTRVSSLNPVGVELFYRSGTNPLVKIADATRVGQSDAYEAYWPVAVADGSYTLVARIRDTTIVAEQTVTVRNEDDPFDPTTTEFETVEITAPLNGDRATFVRGRLPVRGVASAGAEGVILYYTKSGSLTTPPSTAWTQCGTSTLPAGSSPKEFTLDCALGGGDQPSLVTGVAAVAYNCFGSCDVEQSSNSGDAHRVIGVEANPILGMEPAEAAAGIDTCQKLVVTLTDQTGQPIPGQNLDAHLVGPGGGGNFCAPEDGTGTGRRAPNEGGHLSDGDETDEGYHDEGGSRTRHTETESTGNGRFVFGIESATAGDSQVTVWLDANDNDVQDQGETNDISIMHWRSETSSCDITGTNGPDVLEGSDASEKICGFGGNDTIRGRGGNDVIGGGAGNDSLRGGGGNDRVSSGAGNDKAFGGGGKDRVSGGAGRDTVKGHRSNDRLRGNRGNDRLTGGRGRDDCRGGGGRDRLRSCETGTRSFAARTRPI